MSLTRFGMCRRGSPSRSAIDPHPAASRPPSPCTGRGLSSASHRFHCNPLALACPAFAEKLRDLAVIVEDVAFEGVEQRFGEVVQIQARDFADVLHHKLDLELA